MKTRKTAFLTALTLGTLLTTLSPGGAQDNHPGQGRPNRPGGPGAIQERMKQMAEQLNLTDEQKEKIKTVYQEQGEQMRTLREDQILSPEEKRAKFREMFQGLEEKIKPILTTEQQEKWQKLRTEPGGPGGGAGNLKERMEKAAEALNLTADQKEKLKAVLAEQGEKMKELRENQSLSREEKAAKFREMSEGIEAKIKPILTAEQLEKWKELRKQQGPPRRGRPDNN